MADVIVIGGGPAGYSAALFTAKYGLMTVVFDPGETRMHRAYLYNYLGVEEVHGSELMRIARRQAERFGAKVREERVTKVQRDGEAFTVEAEGGGRLTAKYLVIATGVDAELLKGLGVEMVAKEAEVDRHGQTSVENVYAAGWAARSQSQAIISAGDGAAAAIHLIAKEAGRPYHDFDVPPSDE